MSKPSFTPMRDRVLVRVIQESEGDFIVPEDAKEKPQRGTVVVCGPGFYADTGQLIPMTLREGDVVSFGKYAGTDINISGEDFKCMREEEVLGFDPATRNNS